MSATLTKLRELNVEQQIGDLDREVSRQSMGEYLRPGGRFRRFAPEDRGGVLPPRSEAHEQYPSVF